MKLLDSLGRWARLASLVGLAAGSLLVQACTRESPGGGDASVDAAAPPDAHVEDARVPDAEVPRDADALDAQLWDVICE